MTEWLVLALMFGLPFGLLMWVYRRPEAQKEAPMIEDPVDDPIDSATVEESDEPFTTVLERGFDTPSHGTPSGTTVSVALRAVSEARTTVPTWGSTRRWSST